MGREEEIQNEDEKLLEKTWTKAQCEEIYDEWTKINLNEDIQKISGKPFEEIWNTAQNGLSYETWVNQHCLTFDTFQELSSYMKEKWDIERTWYLVLDLFIENNWVVQKDGQYLLLNRKEAVPEFLEEQIRRKQNGADRFARILAKIATSDINYDAKKRVWRMIRSAYGHHIGLLNTLGVKKEKHTRCPYKFHFTDHVLKYLGGTTYNEND